jgi:hypothetical protein
LLIYLLLLFNLYDLENDCGLYSDITVSADLVPMHVAFENSDPSYKR